MQSISHQRDSNRDPLSPSMWRSEEWYLKEKTLEQKLSKNLASEKEDSTHHTKKMLKGNEVIAFWKWQSFNPISRGWWKNKTRNQVGCQWKVFVYLNYRYWGRNIYNQEAEMIKFRVWVQADNLHDNRLKMKTESGS